MNRFLENAAEILQAAENVLNTGETPSPVSILLGCAGGIRIVADSDWPLESLQLEYGASAAYRVNPSGGRVSVDGRDGMRTCHLETDSAPAKARAMLNSVPSAYLFSYAALPQLAA